MLGGELHGAELVLEANAAHLGAFVLQGAVNVAGLGLVAIGDFPGDPNVGEIASEEVANLCGELGDREGTAFRHEVELKLAHGRSEEHTSELQSPDHLVCRLLLEKKNGKTTRPLPSL